MASSSIINTNAGQGMMQKSVDPTVRPFTITFGSLAPVLLNLGTKFAGLGQTQVENASAEEETSGEASLPVIQQDTQGHSASVEEVISPEASQPVIEQDTQVDDNASVDKENGPEASLPVTQDTQVQEEVNSGEAPQPVIEETENASLEVNSQEAAQPVIEEAHNANVAAQPVIVEAQNANVAAQPVIQQAQNANVAVPIQQAAGRRIRKRILWTYEEEKMLTEGVEACSNQVVKYMTWKKILEMGRHVFHPSRTSDNLKDKWSRMHPVSPPASTQE